MPQVNEFSWSMMSLIFLFSFFYIFFVFNSFLPSKNLIYFFNFKKSSFFLFF